MLTPILCFASCQTSTAGLNIPVVERPATPTEPSITWIHLRPDLVSKINEFLTREGQPLLEPGELLTYSEFKKLSQWVVEQRAFVQDLEDTLDYYEASVLIAE
jgi:hypothetical protein